MYWIHFQNIHIFTYQKTLFNTLLLLDFKIIESLQCILNWNSSAISLTYRHFKYGIDKSQTVKLFFLISKWKIADCHLPPPNIEITAVVYRIITIQLEPNPAVWFHMMQKHNNVYFSFGKINNKVYQCRLYLV